MFYAALLICASLDQTAPDFNNCLTLEDLWGPYRTQEHCEIRVNQMETNVMDPAYSQALVFMPLGHPPHVLVRQLCIRNANENET